MSRRTSLVLVLAAATVALGAAVRVRAARAGGIPVTAALEYAGVLEDEHGPVDGTRSLQVQVFAAATGGAALCASTKTLLNVKRGRFTISLPDDCTAVVSNHEDLWIDVVVEGAQTGRTKIGAVPYAVETQHAETATNLAGTSALRTLGGQARTPTGTVDLDKTQTYWQAESTVCMTTASGTCVVAYPKAFPHGVISAVVANGDTLAAWSSGAVRFDAFDLMATQMSVQTGAPSALVRINYTVMGW